MWALKKPITFNAALGFGLASACSRLSGTGSCSQFIAQLLIDKILKGICEIDHGDQFPHNFANRSAICVISFQVIIAELHVANEFNLLSHRSFL